MFGLQVETRERVKCSPTRRRSQRDGEINSVLKPKYLEIIPGSCVHPNCTEIPPKKQWKFHLFPEHVFGK